MSKLDQALEAYLKDETQQDAYYAMVLDTDFYVPLQIDENETSVQSQESVQPLILESEGKYYVMLFDSEERLKEWAKKSVRFAIITGQLAADISTPNLHWAMNVGSAFAKEFVPEEIAHLKTFALAHKIDP